MSVRELGLSGSGEGRHRRVGRERAHRMERGRRRRASIGEISARENRTGIHPAIQEFIRGPAYSVGGLFHEGKPMRVVASSKTHTLSVSLRWTHGERRHRRQAPVLAEAVQGVAGTAIHRTRPCRIYPRRARWQVQISRVNPRYGDDQRPRRGRASICFTPYRQIAAGIRVEPNLRFKSGLVCHRILREVRLIPEWPRRFVRFHKRFDGSSCARF